VPQYFTTGFSRVVYRTFEGFCRDEGNQDVMLVAVAAAASEAACADECSQQAGCSAFEWYPETAGYRDRKCHIYTGNSADEPAGGNTINRPVRGGGSFLDAQCRVTAAATTILPASFGAEWSRAEGVSRIGWKLDSPSFPRDLTNFGRLENAVQSEGCGQGEWQVGAFNRNTTNWGCCKDCPGGAGKCYDDCGCKCSRAKSCSDISR